ncbi:MAG TPA: SRPBCC family protein [Verrucomicrobiae bacterium]
MGDSLKDFVENVDREFFLSREFDAPRELVWEVMTKPEHVTHWWGPRGFTTTNESMDFRVGGVWKHVMHGPDGVNYPNEKVFKEIVPMEKIVFSHGGRRENGPSVDAVATWTFDKIGERKTKVSLRMVFPSASELKRVVEQFGAIEGGKQTLERLGEYLGKMQAGKIS